MTTKPNILIILADDMGVDVFRINDSTQTVTAHVVGKTSVAGPVSLPTFGKLMRSGVNFKHAWAHPVCTPTRGSLWTGLQPWRTGLGYPTFADLDPSLKGDDELPHQTIRGESMQVQSLAEALKSRNAGYRCAMFGKWDLGSENNPVKRGWDAFAGTFRGSIRGDASLYGFPVGNLNVPGSFMVPWVRLIDNNNEKCQDAAAVLRAKYGEDFLRNAHDLRFYIWEKDVVGPDGELVPNTSRPSQRAFPYATEDEVEDAKRWIHENKQHGPWCVAVNLITPHDPFHVPPPGTFTVSFADPTKPTVQEMLVAMIESMDYYVKSLLDGLGDQLENTVVIFVGDNGTQDNDPDNRAVSVDDTSGDDKGGTGIGGVHVPLMVADGGVLAGRSPCYVQSPGRSVAGPVHIIDLYDTVLDIAGVQTPTNNDSVSIAPTLRQGAPLGRQANFSQMYTPMPFNFPVNVASLACDAKFEFKLACEVLVNKPAGKLVDRSGALSPTPVWDYKLVKIVADDDRLGPVVGAYRDEPIADVFEPLPDGSFKIKKTEHTAKILELYNVLKSQSLNSQGAAVPIIHDPLFQTVDLRITLRSDSGNFMTRCNGCLQGAAYPDNVSVHVTADEIASAPWAQFTLKHLDNGKVALIADTGNCVARCNGCVAAAYPDAAFIHVSAAELGEAPWAQFTLERLANGKCALQADTGNYLARCNGCANGAYPDNVFMHVTREQLQDAVWAHWEIKIMQ